MKNQISIIITEEISDVSREDLEIMSDYNMVPSYCGKDDWWKFPAYATEDVVIEKGSRIAQFRILENQPKIHFVESVLEDKNRGGFGSTGKM